MGMPALAKQVSLEASAVESSQTLRVNNEVRSSLPIEIAQATSAPSTPSVSQLSQASAPIAMDQVTSVSQLSDVRPTDWAFQALQSLVERYGCIAGYPDKTYRGNRAMTRFEFAAGLNACLDRVNELIAAATADLVKKEDLATLQKLQEEFAAELATLRGRVDALEARTTTLEKQQFSTTTKLSGEAIFSLSSAYGSYRGGNAGFINNTNGNLTLTPGVIGATPAAVLAANARAGRDANTVFNNRVRLNLNTSFSGKDLLITGLQAYNFGGGPSILGTSGGSLAGTLGYGDAVFGNASHTRLGFEPQFPTVSPQDLGARGGNNSVSLYKLLYIFPLVNKFTAFVGTNAEVSDAFPSILPWASEGQGAISRFATLPAAQRVSGGTSQTGLASAAGFIFNLSDTIDLRALYGSVNANVVNNAGFPGTPLGAGVFNGSYVVATQLTVKPTSAIDIGLNYAHSYHQINILGTGLGTGDIGSVIPDPARLNAAQLAQFTRRSSTGLGLLGGVANQGIKLNTFGATVAFKFSPTITLAGSASYIRADLVDLEAGTDFLSWLVGIQVRDVFRKGNSAGLIFGSPLYRIAVRDAAVSPEDRTPYQVEGYFNFRVNDNISITPGAFVIFNPEGFSSSRTVVVPVIRTTFTF
ncbi:iron uptake porin [Phormidesmis sp. 146-33]